MRDNERPDSEKHGVKVGQAFRAYLDAAAGHHALDARLKERLGEVSDRRAMIEQGATYAKYAGSVALMLSAGGGPAIIDYLMGAYKGVRVAKVLDMILPNAAVIHAVDYLAPGYLSICDEAAVAKVAEAAMRLASGELQQACQEAPLDAVMEGISKLMDAGLPEKESGLCGMLMLQAVGLECRRQGKNIETVRDEMVAGIEQAQLMMQAQAGVELDAEQLAALKEKSPKTAEAIKTIHQRVKQKQVDHRVRSAIESASQLIIGLGVLAGEPALVKTGVVACQVTEVGYSVYQVTNQLGSLEQWLSGMGVVNGLIQLALSFRQQAPSIEVELLKQVGNLSRQLNDAKDQVLDAVRDEHQQTRWQVEDFFEALGEKVDALESSVDLRQQMLGLSLLQELRQLGEQVSDLKVLCEAIFEAQHRDLVEAMDAIRRGHKMPTYFEKISFDRVDAFYAKIFTAAQRTQPFPRQLNHQARLRCYHQAMQDPDRSILIVLSAMNAVEVVGRDSVIVLPSCWLTMVAYLEEIIRGTSQHDDALDYKLDELEGSARQYLSLLETAQVSIDDKLLQACDALKESWRRVAGNFEDSMMQLIKAAAISHTKQVLRQCQTDFQRAFDPAATVAALDSAVPVDRTEERVPGQVERVWNQYGNMLGRAGPAAVVVAPLTFFQMLFFATPVAAVAGEGERRRVTERKRYQGLVDEVVLRRYASKIQTIFSTADAWIDTINFSDLIKVVSADSHSNRLHHVRAGVPRNFHDCYLPARVMFMKLDGKAWPLPVPSRLTINLMSKLRDASPALLTDLLLGRVTMTLTCQLQSGSRVAGWSAAAPLPKDSAKYDVTCVLKGAVNRMVKIATVTHAYPSRAEKTWCSVLSECDKGWSPVATAMILQVYGHGDEPHLGVWDLLEDGMNNACVESVDQAGSHAYLLNLQKHVCQRWSHDQQITWPAAVSVAQRSALNTQLTQLARDAHEAMNEIEFNIAEIRALMHVMGMAFRAPQAPLYGRVHLNAFLALYQRELGVYDNSGAGLFDLRRLVRTEFSAVPTTRPWCYEEMRAAQVRLRNLSVLVASRQTSDNTQRQLSVPAQNTPRP